MSGPAEFKITDVRVEMTADDLAAFFGGEDGPVAKHLLSLGAQVERLAKIYSPVDTGRLRSSITTLLAKDGDGLAAWVGSDVEYAVYVEFGTRFQTAQSFLRRALEEVLG